jgi:hypothetical protein
MAATTAAGDGLPVICRVGFVKPCEIRTFSLVLIVSDLPELA